jgi:hypothetical protein
MMRGAALVAALFALLATGARAEERITDYTSQVAVAPDGTLGVTEEITVLAEGQDIRHGIYRDFPTTYVTASGMHVRVGFNVVAVSLDGHAEPYTLESVEAGARVKIGEANVLLPRGPHRFTLSYTSDRQIRFFPDYDELYWNVTGNYWQFPIDHAQVTVTLPQGGDILQYATYTGAAGARGTNARAQNISNTAIRFQTTAPLGRYEGLTVAVGFSKGAIAAPTQVQQTRFFLRDHAATVVAIAGVLALLVYFAVAWYEHARPPKRGVIVPLFAPPQGFSPAAVRFVRRMGYDRKDYAASLVNMAVKGYLTIGELDGVYTLTRTGPSEAETGLSRGEAAMAQKLFAPGTRIELKQTTGLVQRAIAQSISALRSALAGEYERSYFVTNRHWFLGGAAILALTTVAASLLADEAPKGTFILLWLTGWTVGTAVLVHRAWNAWGTVFAGPGSRWANLLSAFGLTLFTVPFAGFWFVALYFLGAAVPLTATIALGVGGVWTYIFYHALKAPTLAGAKVLDQIEGFRLFLVTAEQDRLEALNPPEVTPEVFERFLPYAIALDCENQWSRKFEAQAEAAGRAEEAGYTPGWYSSSSSGGSYGRFDTATFAGALGTSMAAAAAAAASPPGSSGSGGGGSSGGGGGGGGGGGW